MGAFVLIVGLPGSGKTTLVERIRNWCPGRRVDGFTTREVRDAQGQRVGFDLIDWSTGEAFPLARRTWTDAPSRVGRYGVRPEALDVLVDRMVARNPTPPELWVFDELGKMESLSRRFREWLVGMDLTEGRLIATGPVQPLPAYVAFLQRWRPEIWEIAVSHREAVAHRLRSWLQVQGLVGEAFGSGGGSPGLGR